MFKLAFYKSEYGNWLDKLIAWWTRPNFWKLLDYKSYSHVEMYFSNGLCFSSSPRDGGTRWKKIGDIETSGKWDFLEFPHMDEEKLIGECSSRMGLSYDYWALFFNFLIDINWEDKKKWFCSEICAALPFHLLNPCRFSPNKLSKFLLIHKYLSTNKL